MPDALLDISGVVGLNTGMMHTDSDDSDTPTHFELHLSAEASGQTIIELIAANCSLSKQKIKSVLDNGAVWFQSGKVIQRVRRAKKTVNKEDRIHLYFDDKIQKTKPENAALIADEGDYSIWNKPCGMYSQGTKWGDHCTIYRWAEKHLTPQRPAFLVHRLDRAANGLILLAHSKNMASQLSTLFSKRKIVKRYRATVAGKIDTPLPFTIDDPIDNRPARTTILSSESGTRGSTTLGIEIETGRKHQIRKHLAGLGHVIIGDRLYGSKQTQGDLQLQACYLKFTCPVTGKKREYSL